MISRGFKFHDFIEVWNASERARKEEMKSNFAQLGLLPIAQSELNVESTETEPNQFSREFPAFDDVVWTVARSSDSR